MIIQGLTLVAAAVLNRFRGGGFYADKIPVKALWVTFPLIGALAYFTHGSWTLTFPYHGFWVPVAFSLAFLIWALPPWGRWYDHGRMLLPNREPTRYEENVENISVSICHRFGLYGFRPVDMLSHFIRHLMLVPGMGLLYLVTGNYMFLALAIPLAFLIVILYEVGWILHDSGSVDNPIEIAELLVGVLWGALIAFS